MTGAAFPGRVVVSGEPPCAVLVVRDRAAVSSGKLAFVRVLLVPIRRLDPRAIVDNVAYHYMHNAIKHLKYSLLWRVKSKT